MIPAELIEKFVNEQMETGVRREVEGNSYSGYTGERARQDSMAAFAAVRSLVSFLGLNGFEISIPNKEQIAERQAQKRVARHQRGYRD